MRYKFRYYNRTLKILGVILVLFQNFMLPLMLFMPVVTLLGKLAILIGLEDYIVSETFFLVSRRIVVMISLAWDMIYCAFPKGVFLYDDHLVIARYTVTISNWKNRIYINYYEIEKVNVNYTDLHFTKHHFSLLVPMGDYAYNVELTLKTGKKYFFSIENPEEFCENLNSILENRRQIVANENDKLDNIDEM